MKNITLNEITKSENIGLPRRVNVQVTNSYRTSFTTYSKWLIKGSVWNTKTQKDDTFEEVFDIIDNGLESMLPMLVDAGATASKTKSFILMMFKELYNDSPLAYIKKDKIYITEMGDPVVLHKVDVKDYLTRDDSIASLTRKVEPVEITLYTKDEKLLSGGKYNVEMIVVPHTANGQANIAMALKVDDSEDFLTNFKVNDDVVESLKVFQPKGDDGIDSTLTNHFEKMKDIGDFFNEQIYIASNLTYHSVQSFNVGNRKDIKGMLDVYIIGDPATGKSSCASSLNRLYGQGLIISMKDASIKSLVGGSDKDSTGKNKVALGLLPLNDGGLVNFEEMSDSANEITKALTYIRSEQIAKISRVGSHIEAPARVRYLSISNTQKDYQGRNRLISQYTNKLEIIRELVPAHEDIRRYDLFLLAEANDDDDDDDLNADYDEPFSITDLRNRLCWAWTRSVDQVIYTPEAFDLLQQRNKDLKKLYRHIELPLVGKDAYAKIFRVAAALAATLCSTDETYENVIVTDEHIEWAFLYIHGTYQATKVWREI